MDFGTVGMIEPSRTEEVELTLTSTGGGRYRVYQEFQGLLVNERGDRLPEGRLTMQISRGLTGTPATGGIVAVTEATQELFVSRADGASDTLLLAYAIVPDPGCAAGLYQGLLRYAVESLEDRTIGTQTLRVRAAVKATLSIERPPGSPSRLSFGDVQPGEQTSPKELLLDIANNTAAPAELIQEMSRPLSSSKGDQLAARALVYLVSLGSGDQAWRSVTETPDVVFTGEDGHMGTLRIAYQVAVPNDQPAGEYQGALGLRLAGLVQPAVGPLRIPVELTVKEVFTISVEPVDQAAAALHFGRTQPSEETVERSMRVAVQTNLGRAYQVLAGLDHPLVLDTGDMLPSDALMLAAFKAGHGEVVHPANSPIGVGYQPLYRSDAKGSADSFILTYRLGIPRDAKEGTYSSHLRFTVTIF